MADLLLSMRSDPERAMAMAEEAMRLSTQKAGPGQVLWRGREQRSEAREILGALGRCADANASEVRGAAGGGSRGEPGCGSAGRCLADKAATPVLRRLVLGKRIARGRVLQMSVTHFQVDGRCLPQETTPGGRILSYNASHRHEGQVQEAGGSVSWTRWKRDCQPGSGLGLKPGASCRGLTYRYAN